MILGINPPYHDIKFGSFTGNKTLIQWFASLNHAMGVKGTASIYWKIHGKSRTIGSEPEDVLPQFLDDLRNPNKAFIYHGYNHYFCPIGYELTPICPTDVYKPLSEISVSQRDPWIVIGDPSKTSPCFQTKKWSDIVLDLQ